jgi:hypothetical protein
VRIVGVAAVLGACAHGLPDAPADALACARTKAWDARAEGWSLRTLEHTALGLGERRAYATTLMAGRTYRVLSCAQGSLVDLDLALLDERGDVVLTDHDAGREPVLDLVDRPGTWTLVLYGRRVSASTPGGAAFALLHR